MTDTAVSPRRPNAELLQRTLAHIQANPAEWYQAEWAQKTACGTRYCFAGTAIHLTHPEAEFVFEHDRKYEDAVAATFVRVNGNVEIVESFAAAMLGLDRCEALELFSGGNILEDLEHAVETLADPAYDGSFGAGWGGLLDG